MARYPVIVDAAAGIGTQPAPAHQAVKSARSARYPWRVLGAGGSDVPLLVGTERAVLLFLLWALTFAPRHAQRLDGSWVPPHWITWATEQGYAPPEMHAILQ